MRYRPIESEDLAYVWAAYKKGAFEPAGGVFADGGQMSAAQFRDAFTEQIVGNFDACWTLFAKTKERGMAPVGIVVGFWTHPGARFMILERMVWFPWSTARNRVEAAVNFFTHMRREVPMLGFARDPDKAFFVVLMRHGIIRQVGTSMTVFGDAPAAVYETRWSAS